jgi:hypothetical protein
MTHHDPSGHSDVTPPSSSSDDRLREGWYKYAATQPWSVGSLLSLLRRGQNQSVEQQQAEFGVSAKDFARLQSMRQPRPEQFASDAERMASVCHAGKPLALVQALLLARSLAAFATSPHISAESDDVGYEAAYDASEHMEDSEDGE